MSVLVIAKFQGDTAVFRQAVAERGDEFAKIAEASKAAGGIHHRFGINAERLVKKAVLRLLEDEVGIRPLFPRVMANCHSGISAA